MARVFSPFVPTREPSFDCCPLTLLASGFAIAHDSPKCRYPLASALLSTAGGDALTRLTTISIIPSRMRNTTRVVPLMTSIGGPADPS